MCDEDEDILFLDIENTLVKCKRNDLIKHSDYFKAMLEGNFAERDQNRIKIEGVDLKAMNIILILLWDETYLISEEDILPVLQAACMMQFDKVKDCCLEKVNEMLRLDNCIRIWTITEQLSLKPLYLKAKLMALQEFVEVKDSESLLDFNLDQILDYLGNIYLTCDSELTVFQTGMKWWYEHCEHFSSDSTNVLMKLLSCLDFNSLDDNGFNEIMLYPDICGDEKIMGILGAVKELKKKGQIVGVMDCTQEKAQLLCNTKCRVSPSYVAILVNVVPLHCGDGRKSSSFVGEQLEVIYDKFKRKRVLLNILASKPENVMAVYYDEKSQKFKSFFVINQNKCENLEGFKIVGYKELVFLYGGQHLIGKGEWNVNFWVYDSVRERWERKTRMPHCRRHFESCIVDNKVVVASGIGNYRIIQDNAFFYDYKMDVWSNTRTIPQMKCCNFLNKCFFFSTVVKCGYFWEFNSHSQNILEVDIVVDETILKNQSEYAIFSFKDKLFIKGKDLIELGMENNKLLVKSILPITNLDYDKLEVTTSNEMVYTFYKYKTEEGATKYSLESLNLKTKQISFIFENLSENDQVGENENEMFLMNSKLKVFTITHYSLVEENTVINISFRNDVNT